MLFKNIFMVLLLAGSLAAQSTSGSISTNSSSTSSTTGTVVITVTPNLKPQLDEQGKELDQLKVSLAKLEAVNKELVAKCEALLKTDAEILLSLKAVEAGMKVSGEKTLLLDKNLEGLKVKLETINEELSALNKKVETDKLLLTGLKTQSDSFKVKLDIAQDDVKVRSDELKALKDALSIIKGNINSNITDTIEIKNAVNELKAKNSGKPAEGLMSWEYLGIVTSGVAVLALVLSIVK